jgi:hypothetical protein
LLEAETQPDPNKSRKVPVLSAQFRRYLDQLVDLGYGKTPTDAARYLIDRGIDDLIRAPPAETITEVAATFPAMCFCLGLGLRLARKQDGAAAQTILSMSIPWPCRG